MKIFDLADSYENFGNVVKITDFDNFFNVYTDKQNKYCYNINSTLYFDVDDARTSKFITTSDLHWPTISYCIYQTTRLAWLLMKINKVKPDHIFNIIKAGTTVKYIPVENVQKIVESIR